MYSELVIAGKWELDASHMWMAARNTSREG
jgi:hypothetical protein